MSAAILWRLAWGDFRDRVRSSRFLLVAVATAALGTLSVPQQGRYTTLTVGGYRGLYNSAWVGASVALVTTVFLSLFGFYLVNDAIRRDRQTGVGQVLAATPVTRTVYILSKVVSNFALLSILVAVLAVVAGVMQVLRGEAPVIEPWPLLAPFLLVTLPGLAVVSALAVLFESTRPLRGVLGNILYFFVWLSILGLSLSATESAAGSTIPDVFGVSLVLGAIRGAVRLYTSSTDFTLLEFGGAKPATFVWEGMAWSPQLIAARLIWIPLAALIVALAVPLFDRFDSPPPIQRISVRQREGAGPAPEALPSIPAWLREAPGDRCTFALAPMTVQELRLLLKEAGLWWHLGAVALMSRPVENGVFVSFRATDDAALSEEDARWS